MSLPTPHLLKHKGLLNLPGPTYATKLLAEQLLLKDAMEHHCFFKPPSFHNHLSHHLLAAYDLGAGTHLLQSIYEKNAKIQRPIILDPNSETIQISDENWIQYVGNADAYRAFLYFFAQRIASAGVAATLDEYIFDPKANDNGVNMCIRLMSGALHSFIQIGYGIEFGNDNLVATGLAQAAVHISLPLFLFPTENPPNAKENTPSGGKRYPSRGPSLLEILRQIYDSDILKPVMPYDPNANMYERLKAAMAGGRPQELLRICSQYYVDETAGEEEFNAKMEEIIFASVLATFATGREGREPRLDFFLMHLATSSLFLPSFFSFLKNPAHKARLLRTFPSMISLLLILRGRPMINPSLLMSYTDRSRPPIPKDQLPQPDDTAMGNPFKDESYNPWSALISAALYAPDCHVLKTMRTLLYAARKYGDMPPGSIIGAFRKVSDDGPQEQEEEETLVGIGKMDGSVFVRAAGVLVDYMGWVTHGQPARDDWDRSGLGWDEAWEFDEIYYHKPEVLVSN